MYLKKLLCTVFLKLDCICSYVKSAGAGRVVGKKRVFWIICVVSDVCIMVAVWRTCIPLGRSLSYTDSQASKVSWHILNVDQ